MKKSLVWLVIVAVVQMAFLTIASAATLNYQGKLSSTSGTPINSSVTVSVKLYTVSSGGTALYTENIGSVSVANGLFSFNWGGAGTSLVSVIETIGVTAGTSSVFNGTAQHLPINLSTVTISDGTYSWSDVSGSTSPGNFLGTVSSYPAGTVSAIYLSGNPSAGRTITLAYKYNSTGCNATIQSNSNLWLGVTIDGTELTPRRSLGDVPRSVIAEMAIIANTANIATLAVTASNAITANTSLSVKGQTLYVDDLTGRVGVGTNNPSSTLTVKGVIETTSGGVKFPDGTVQNTAVLSGVTNLLLVTEYHRSGSLFYSPLIRGNENSFIAPVSLPLGSKIIDIEGVAYDSATGAQYCYVQLALNVVGTNNVSSQLAYFATTTAFSGGSTNFYVAITSNNLVSSCYRHFVTVDCVNGVYSGNEGVDYVLIRYVQ